MNSARKPLIPGNAREAIDKILTQSRSSFWNSHSAHFIEITKTYSIIDNLFPPASQEKKKSAAPINP